MRTRLPKTGNASVADLPLWPHQVEALAMAAVFIEARAGRGGKSGLIRMPTGTGKSGVIAVAAHHLVERGDVLVLAPWDALVEQLTRDIRERFWRRVGSEPPRAAVQRIYPSTATRVFAEQDGAAIYTATIATLQQMHAEGAAPYAELARRISLVVVDEGHYEPALSWAKAVRGLARPTLLLTATPYRNDFKFFDVDEAHCFFYSHEQAEEDRFLRRVKFRHHEFDSVRTFCDGLVHFYEEQFAGNRKPRVIVRCLTKNSVQAVTRELLRRGIPAIGIHERFTRADGPDLVHRVPNPEEETERHFWVHQNKLIEGIDDPAFQIIAFFQPFGSERAFVQQVGRVLRNPKQKHNQFAWVFADPRNDLEQSWHAYRTYDIRAEPELLLRSPRDFARLQPSIQYVSGRFREQFDVTSPTAHEDFNYPRSTRAYLVGDTLSLDDLATQVEKEWNEYDFDVQPVLTPQPDTRVHPYIAVRNSPLLLRTAFAEYEVGLTVYRKIRNYLFFYDSQGKTPEALAGLASVETDALQHLYAGEDARLTSVSLRNTALGRFSTRRRVVQAFSIGELAPDLADHANFASTATGITGAPDWSPNLTLTRYVGFTKGRVSDRAGGATPFELYMRWLDYLADALDDEQITPLTVFDRYAEVIRTPQDPTPENILLDFDQEQFEGEVNGAVVALSIEDLSLPVSSGVFRCVANGVAHDVQISWDLATRTYHLDSPSLDSSYAMQRTLGTQGAASVVTFLNREQAFRVVPASAAQDYCIYAGGLFYRPRLPLWGRVTTRRFDVLQILNPVAELAGLASEKGGGGSATGTGWENGSLFDIIDRRGEGTQLADAFAGVDLLICDDMGTETADFIAIDQTGRRVAAIHAKAFPTAKPLSASALHEISAQAVKNLGYFQPYFVGEPKNLRRWDRPWRGPQGTVASRIRHGGLSGSAAWTRVRDLLRDPQATREIWLVLGQGLSKSTLDTERGKTNPAPEVVQVLYSLQATWSSISSVGARLRVFCSP
jgi:superfamily II DNA or RNA helicase